MKHFKATLVLATLCLLLIPSLCQAAYDPIATGTTKLILDKGFLAAAKKAGVKVGPRPRPSSRVRP